MRRALAAFALASLASLACTPRAVIPDEERQRVAAELSGRQRWLRVAAYAGPLWHDRTKVLVTDAPPDELDLVETPGGSTVAPPPPERILPPGTAVRVREVEFPTGWIIARRVAMSPRYHPWVLLDVPGDPRPHVLVLSQTAVSLDDVRGEVDRILSGDDPSSLFAALPPEHREAVLKKELADGMSPRAVEMAWGLPERKRIDRPTAHQEWIWPGGKRKATFQDDRLTRWDR
jgi:hypothetical protein